MNCVSLKKPGERVTRKKGGREVGWRVVRGVGR